MPTAPKKTTPELTQYVVVADVINLTTGRKPSGGSAVTRMYRGNILNAPADHPAVIDLLAMHGIAEAEKVADAMRDLSKHGNAKRPTVQPRGNGLGRSGDEFFRVTAAGVAVGMGAEDDPALNPVEEALPLDAATPDETPLATV